MIRQIIADLVAEARKTHRPALDFIHEAVLSGDQPRSDLASSGDRQQSTSRYASHWDVAAGSALP